MIKRIQIQLLKVIPSYNEGCDATCGASVAGRCDRTQCIGSI